MVAGLGEPASPEPVGSGAAAVRQVLAASELKDQWDESGTEQGEEWELQVEDLLSRLE